MMMVACSIVVLSAARGAVLRTAPSLQMKIYSNMSAIAKQAYALPGTEPRQGMPWLRGEATGLPGL